jgi:hypothetical protein
MFVPGSFLGQAFLSKVRFVLAPSGGWEQQLNCPDIDIALNSLSGKLSGSFRRYRKS